jgi:hypothetical protein
VSAKGTILFRYPGVDVEDLDESCVLDIADRGEHTLADIGSVYRITRERVRQLEYSSLVKMWESRALELYHDQSDAGFKE